MASRPLTIALLLASATFELMAAPAHGLESLQIASGRRLARANCGECHAIGAGRSPFRDAPPFRQLYRRYRAGGLDALLDEGMIARPPIEEEGERFHPRMPSVDLDDTERSDLRAYLQSLEPHRRVRRRQP